MRKNSNKNVKTIKLIGRNIRHVRISCNLTMMDLSFESGIDYRQIGRIERGETNFTILTLLRITEALCINLKDIIIK